MGNLFRTGGGSNEINLTVDTKNAVIDEERSNTNPTLQIAATKNMKKAILVATAASTVINYNAEAGNIRYVSVASSNQLIPLPNANNNTSHKLWPHGNAEHSSLSAACQLYIVNDVKKGDTFTLSQRSYGGVYYKNLQLICID